MKFPCFPRSSLADASPLSPTISIKRPAWSSGDSETPIPRPALHWLLTSSLHQVPHDASPISAESPASSPKLLGDDHPSVDRGSISKGISARVSPSPLPHPDDSHALDPIAHRTAPRSALPHTAPPTVPGTPVRISRPVSACFMAKASSRLIRTPACGDPRPLRSSFRKASRRMTIPGKPPFTTACCSAAQRQYGHPFDAATPSTPGGPFRPPARPGREPHLRCQGSVGASGTRASLASESAQDAAE